jgi:imidazolonepropionase-like amidohydrolase
MIGSPDVLIRSGKIAAVSAGIRPVPGAVVINAAGGTLLPGLIDSHVHLTGCDNPGCKPEEGIPLRKAALFGVTTVIDLGGGIKGFTPREMLERTRRAPAGELSDFLSAGIPVTIAGGHGAPRGSGVPTLEDAARAQEFIDARIAEGSQIIKVIYEDFGGMVPRLPWASMKAAIEAAHARGKLAVVHAGPRAEHVVEAIKAGADGVAHSFFDSAADPGYGQMFVSAGAFLIPTFPLQVSGCALPDNAALGRDPRILPWLTVVESGRLNRAFGKVDAFHGDCTGSFASIPLLRHAGASILAGTDAQNPGTAHGASLHEELDILVRCGLTPGQALIAATSVPARIWGFKDRGRIAAGFRADLLLVNGDPTAEVTSTRKIERVWLSGVLVDRAKLLQKIKVSEQEP